MFIMLHREWWLHWLSVSLCSAMRCLLRWIILLPADKTQQTNTIWNGFQGLWDQPLLGACWVVSACDPLIVGPHNPHPFLLEGSLQGQQPEWHGPSWVSLEKTVWSAGSDPHDALRCVCCSPQIGLCDSEICTGSLIRGSHYPPSGSRHLINTKLQLRHNETLTRTHGYSLMLAHLTHSTSGEILTQHHLPKRLC